MKTNKSMLDIAVEVFNESNEPVAFSTLWQHIVEALELTKEEERTKLPLFYTTLSMDGRFVVLSEDLWDLKSKHAYDEVHRDINDIYSEEEEDDVDDEEGEDEEAGEEKKAKKSKSDDNDSDDEDDSDKDDEE